MRNNPYKDLPPLERRPDGTHYRMTPAQRKQANALIRRECCNCEDGDCIPTIKSCADALRGDEKTGALAVIHALEAPARQIAKNAGRDGSTIAAKLRGLPEAIGYDAGADRFTDMVQAGILDPVRVTRTALQSALSVSASMLTTEACITGNDQSTEA